MPTRPTRILFVCMGNICRSPLAESIFRHLARERGVEDRFEIDSAGTSSYHVGDPPDPRSVSTALARGVTVSGASRSIDERDLREFDYVIVMDADNLAFVDRLHATVDGGARLHRLREWDLTGTALDVPDPYFGGTRGFDDVHDIVERSCAALLDHLLSEGAGDA